MEMHIFDEQTRELALSDGRILLVPAEWLEGSDDPLESVQQHASEHGLIAEGDVFVSLQ